MKKGEMLGTMLVLATTGHAGQFDKGGSPYILHSLKVMHYLKVMTKNCSVLHSGMTWLKTRA